MDEGKHADAGAPPTAPGLEYLTTVRAEVGEILTMGPLAGGVHRVVPILGGSASGPALSGRILPSGQDFQMLRSDRVSELSARYVVETDDGQLVSIDNWALRVADADVMARLNRGERVDPSEVYFRCTPRLGASGPLAWLSERIVVGTGERHPSEVVVHLFAVA